MGLKVWMPLDGDAHNQGVQDFKPTVSGGTWVDGKIGKCFNGGGSGYITLNTDITIQNEFTVSLWVKVNSYNADWARIFDFTKNANEYMGLCYSNNGKIGFHIYDFIDGTKKSLTDGYYWTSEVGVWTHITITGKGNKISRYSNGILINNTSINNASYFDDTYSICRICAYGTSANNKANCCVCDFRVYDYALSEQEIKKLSQGLVIHLPLSRKGFGQDNLLAKATSTQEQQFTYPTSSVSDKFSSKTSIVPSASQYTLSFLAKSTVNGDHLRTHYYNPNTTTRCETSQGIVKTASDGNVDFTLTTGWKQYWVVYTQSETSATKTVICPRLVSQAYLSSASGTGTISIKNVKFEEGNKTTAYTPTINDSLYSALPISNTTAYDISGYQHNATYNNITYSADAPINSMCTHFGATNAKVHISGLNVSGFSNSYSFAWWGKRDSNSPMFWGFSDGCRLNGMYLGHLWNTGDGANNPLYVPGTTTQVTDPTLNVWHHYVMTGDGTKCRVYLDGELWAEAKTYKAISGTSIYLNGWDSGTSYCSTNTDIADFRIYATALSADDVKDLYEKR